MSEPDFHPIASQYWADHLGISLDRLFAQPLSIIVHGGELAGYGGVFALFRHGSIAVSLPPNRVNALHPILTGLPAGFSPGELSTSLKPMASLILGPAFVGYTDTIATSKSEACSLTPADTGAVDALKDVCTATEWEHGGSDISIRPASGVFVGNQLAALAGYEIWGGTIAHFAVVTHPGHRGRGYGKAVVAHLAARAITEGLLPQYRTLDSNQPSLRIAEALGFQRYATSVAVRLKN